ncbi:hypothetical protein [Blautia obeum]|uniref:hypothetical protein n=1 Tax=Blautia obeum TaxID=40520 RepID=UPI0015FCAD7D|nr:hypothetical protein [Blautia obeum]
MRYSALSTAPICDRSSIEAEFDISTETAPFRMMISGWNPFLTGSGFVGRLISANEIFCGLVSSAGLVITESSFDSEASKASFLRILCQ